MPPCPGSPTTNYFIGLFWTDCFGTYTSADGTVKEGIWENGEFLYAKKPTVTPEKLKTNVDEQKPLELARRTQEALQVLGLYSGKLDGIIGARTKSAIQRWQKRNGYPGTGEVTELQLSKLEKEASDKIMSGISAYLKKDYATALRVLKTPAQMGNALAQNLIGMMYFLGQGVPQNHKTAVKWLRLSAENGFALSQITLGDLYAKGLGMPKNYKEALKWYALAAKQGFADPKKKLENEIATQGNKHDHYNLGVWYYKGDGVPQDYKTAVKWWRLSADQGNAGAQHNLGVMYEKGQGVPQNHKTAVKWYRPAAEQGFADAQYNLGVMYSKGQGVPQDYKTAVKWYRLAAEQGFASAQHNLARMYYLGTGVPKDYVYSYMWANIAASSGKEDAVKGRDIVAKEMTPSQIEKAQQLARNFVPKKSPEPQVKKKPKPSGTSGSGFFISKLGHVITNQHIVSKCKEVTVRDNSKKQVTATVLETDRSNDLALLRISNMQMASVETKSLIRKLGIKVVPLASDGLMRAEDVELGEDVLVAGYPYGEVFSDDIKVNKGIVSGLRGMGDDTGQFQIDAAVQPGNSGGPIYDENGNIVGVVVSQLNKMKFAKATGSMPENVNFGIKASTVRQFLNASGLPTKWSTRSKSMSTRELAKIAKSQTVMVVCHQ